MNVKQSVPETQPVYTLPKTIAGEKGNTVTTTVDQYLSKKQVVKMTSYSATSLWRAYRAGLMPAPRQIGIGRIAWLRSKIEAWMMSRPLAIKSEVVL